MGIETSKTKLGGNIDSWCGKCKLVLAHTIEAMVGDKPARVHCNTCKSQHSYRAHGPGAVARVPRQGDTTRGRGSRYQSLLKAKDSAVVKAYSPSDRYEEGDILEHPTFGRGIATAIKDATKMEVLFESGSKTLVHGR